MAAGRFHLSRRARADLDFIANYLAEHSPDAARRVLSELRESFRTLAQNPHIGTRRDDLHPLSAKNFYFARIAILEKSCGHKLPSEFLSENGH
jgi:plasmid stabilization system protein ParE